MLVPFKDDNPKITENTGFQAGSDSTPMAKFFLLKIIDLFIAILMLPVSFYKRIRTNLKNRHSDT